MNIKINTLLTAVILALLSTGTASFADLNIIGAFHDDRTVMPGNRYEGIILLRNTDDAPQSVDIKQTDYSFTANGVNDFGIPGSNKRSNARWISIPVNKVIIPPKSDISYQYSVQVPADNTLKGTYWSTIMLIPEVTAPEKKLDASSMGITTVFQYCYQVTSQISDSGMISAKFLNKEIVSSEGKTLLKIGLENNGTRLITPTVWAEIFDSTGNNLGKFESQKQRLFPDCSISSNIDISKVPDGTYKALVIVDTQLTDPVGAQYDLVITR
ncbi:MAG: hypothetical protein WC527_05370 [Candidatus Margulisiibacteriota bacterium]